jgi:hypothetical protein
MSIVPTESTTCQICAENYNKRSRAAITCQYCPFEACSQCCQTYILSEPVPKCMNRECSREWTRKFMTDTFPGTFINVRWKAHREQLIFDVERAMLPATQMIVEVIMEQENIDEQIQEINKEISLMVRRRSVLYDQRHRIGIGNTEQSAAAVERRQFTRACPDAECRGFLSTQWKCGLCAQWTCPHCNVVKGADRDEPHECNPDDVASAALIRQDTKPCPSCGMGIFRIEGCSQMWCTQCNTAFCWNTGRIQTNIHNPHYFEWLRRTGGNAEIARNPLDILCGRELNTPFVRLLNQSMESCDRYDAIKGRRVLRLTRAIIHLNHVDMRTYHVDNVQNNQTLRIQYLRKQITEEKFKSQLQKNDKKHRKHRDIMNVLQMITNTCADILYRFLEEVRKDGWMNDYTIVDEIYPLIEYANTCLHEVSETYGSVRLAFNDKMELGRREIVQVRPRIET